MKTMVMKQMGRIALALLAGALVTACMDNGETEDARTWKGLIQNTCGSADGPAIAIRIGRSADTTCNADFASDTSYSMYLDDYHVDSLRLGQVLTDSVFVCGIDDCIKTSVLKLKIEGVTTGSLSGSLEIKNGGDGVPVKIRTVPIILKKCPKTGGMCG